LPTASNDANGFLLDANGFLFPEQDLIEETSLVIIILIHFVNFHQKMG